MILELVDKSNSTSIFIIIYYGDPANNNGVGTISVGEANEKIKELNEMKKSINGQNIEKTTISGYNAIIEDMGDSWSRNIPK